MRRNRDDRSEQLNLAGPGRAFATYDGTSGNDVYAGTDAADTINGYGGNDTLSGGGGDDTIDGGDGNDTIDGGTGHNVLRGGAGTNSITSSGGIDTVIGTGGSSSWTGFYARTAEDLTFDAVAGTLSNGTTLADVYYAKVTSGYGNDTFNLSALRNADVDGGAGSDTVNVDYSQLTYVDEWNPETERLKVVLEFKNGAFDTMFAGHDGDGYQTFKRTAVNVEHLAVIGSRSDDYFSISSGIDLSRQSVAFDGGDGRDTLFFSYQTAGSNRFVVADDGSIDTNVGSFANFEVFGVAFGSGTNVVTTGAENDLITTSGSGDELHGGAGNDTITVRGTDALADGGMGNDTITTYGADALVVGGEGDDIWQLIFDGQTAARYDQTAPGDYNGTVLQNIEHSRIVSKAGPVGNTFVLDGSGPDVTLQTANALDRVTIDLSQKTSAVSVSNFTTSGLSVQVADGLSAAIVAIVGSDYEDAFSFDYSGTRGLRTVDGGAGSDFIALNLGSVQSDVTFVVGQDGTITSSVAAFANLERFAITIYQSNSVVTTGAADDTITVIQGGNGVNQLAGAGGDDTITGGDNLDRLDGGAGDDLLLGGRRNDVLIGGRGDDIIDGGDGFDTASYADAVRGVRVAITDGVQDTLGAGKDLLSGIEYLTGSSYRDTLTGDGLANRLTGNDGNDRLSGGDGADVLTGGAGADRANGGAGADTFAFTAIGDFAAKGRDRIGDFSHADGDRIDVKAIDPGAAAGDQAFVFVGSAAFSHTGGAELRATAHGAHAFLVSGDTDGDGKADFSLLVTAAAPLVAGDFVL